ncbi:uncharacterized protein ATC70_003686 [Mucor velutinosus]|uniref:Arrestin-like N-terminal domain-containing protein n=1 Tax=Mucor velutinosus TaxID=708070 RepID=A0AAN7HRZ9_9FUNG|nr:hypothetical protein ATC70_003686 [Mucor velutinosus]
MPTTTPEQQQQYIMSLERTSSWHDILDTPAFDLEEGRSSSSDDDNYRYVDPANRKFRKPPVQFSISILRIDGDTQKKTCHPGSIFEGVVKLKLDTPLAAQHLKLVFKGAERIHSDTIGKANKKRGERLFAIRTILWGKPSCQNNLWPLIESGEHVFPFMCEIPMVNYPPTFRHHLASCEFELLASLERPALRPFQTVPYQVRYEPFIESKSIKLPNIYQEKLRLDNTHNVVVTLVKGCDYNILDSRTETMKVQLSIINLQKGKQHQDNNAALFNHIEAYVKREVDVTHGSYHRADTMVMTHVEQSKFGVGNHRGACTYYINIPIPIEISKKNNPTILRNFSVLGMTTTTNFSKHIKIEYKLYITAKVRHGLMWAKRQLFCIPLHFGTVAPGEQLPSTLVSYRHPSVTSDTTLSTKPKFIRPPSLEEQLPAYDEETPPPVYCVPIAGDVNTHRQNRLHLITSSH